MEEKRKSLVRELDPITITKTEIKEFATDLGMPLKDYQVDLVYVIVRTEGSVVYYDGPRQTFGKSQVGIVSALILAIAKRAITYTAHRKDTTLSVMRRFAALTRQLSDSDLIEKESLSNGFEQIFFTSGGEIHFRTRTDGTGVGGNMDVIFYDEAQMVSERAISDLDPSVDGSTRSVRVHMGTPPKDDEYRLYPDAPFTTAMLSDSPKFIHGGPKGVWYEPGLEYTWQDHGSKISSWKHKASLKSELAQAWAECATERQKEAFFRDKLAIWKRPETWTVHEPAIDGDMMKKIFTGVQSMASSFYGGIGVLPKSDKAYVSANDGRQLMVAQEIDLSGGDLDPLVDWVRKNARKFKLIRIPANERGKAIHQALLDRGIHRSKIRLVTLPELSSSIARFFKLTEAGELKVYERDYVRIALGSFWLRFDDRSGSNDVASEVPQDQALVLSLMQACVEQQLVSRARSLNDKAGGDTPETLSSTAPVTQEIKPTKNKSYVW